MAVYDHDAGSVWANEDIPSVSAVLADAGKTEFACPNPDCDNELEVRLDDADEDVPELVEVIESNDGTMRCGNCSEPLYGLWKDGDHTNDTADQFPGHGADIYQHPSP